MRELRVAESIAGRRYWQAFARVPIAFEGRWRRSVPDHWHTAGPRTSRLDRKRAKRALTPAHAMLNYLYAILESEATIAAQRMGIRPDARADACRQALSSLTRVGPNGAGEACCR